MDAKVIESYLERIKEFPTLPTVYSTLMDVMSNPRSTAKDVADVILRDQASASKILKVANSSLYGFYGRINTISQAITYIGFDEVKNLVITLSIINLFNGVKKHSHFNPVNLWRHSIAVAVTTRIIGHALGIKTIENFFIAGILHQIGKLFFYKMNAEKYIEVIEYAVQNKIPTKEAEQKILGITYTVAGELLAEKWNLPKSISTAIRYHSLGKSENTNNQIIAAIHVAKVFCLMMNFTNYDGEMITQPNRIVWDQLNLPDQFFTSKVNSIMSSIYESESLLLKIK